MYSSIAAGICSKLLLMLMVVCTPPREHVHLVHCKSVALADHQACLVHTEIEVQILPDMDVWIIVE
eukprot:CAMPEP_0185156892 /NCGR_PEP_ID=MMETSP1139-20130426/1416_1 /TAXON_ID=298111 /ORGANISM="Pavlova sp., Strain CCMP459" /LENGTH=65 /DNA_ID=CAMNT_0027721927 /DNA_START=1 /DNA_END=195 /DNA_ORIENTATION=+